MIWLNGSAFLSMLSRAESILLKSSAASFLTRALTCNIRFPKKHVVRGELFPQNGSKKNVSKTMVLLHEFDDNVAVVATTVASITTRVVQFQAK